MDSPVPTVTVASELASRGTQTTRRSMAGATTMTMSKERGLPSLARGWRTPDPSPSRGVADLPSCKSGPWWAVIKEDPDTDDDVETIMGCFLPPPAVPASRIGRGRSPARQSGSMSQADCGTFVASRTPSPSPSDFQDTAQMWKPLRCKGSSSFSTIYAESECSSGFSPRNSLSLTDGRTLSSTSKTAVPPAVKPVAAWTGPAVPPPPPTAPVLREVLGMPEDCPSVGSMNHPHACADYCKYFKKPKGCKDGDACVRCHICTCKKPKVPQAPVSGNRSRHKKKLQKMKMQMQMGMQMQMPLMTDF